MKSPCTNKRRRTRQEVESLLGRYHQSGMTALAFSKAEAVAPSSLYKWLREQRARPTAPVLVEVASPPGMGTVFSVRTPLGYRIEVPVGFPADALKRLLGVLEG